MTFEEALKAELITIDGLNKVFALHPKEGTKAPYIFYVSSEGLADKTLGGYLTSKEIECEINIVHTSYLNVKNLTKQVLEALISFQGRVIGETGPFIHNVTYAPPVELYEREVSLYRTVIDLKVKL